MPKIQEKRMSDNTSDIDVDEFGREHQHLLDLAMAGNPPRDRLRLFWQKLIRAKKRVPNSYSRQNINYYLTYWRGFLRHSGQFEALDIDSDE